MPRAGGDGDVTVSVAIGCKLRRRPEALAGLVLGEQPAEHRAGVRIDEMDLGEIPGGEADFQQRKMPIAVGNFEAAAFDDGGAIALAQGAPLGAGEGQPQRRGIRAGSRHGGPARKRASGVSSISLCRLRL